MVIKEFYKERNDGVKLYRSYSDEGFKILQVETGVVYDEAVDTETANYTYEETEEKIEEIEEDTNETELKAQAYDILIGEVE